MATAEKMKMVRLYGAEWEIVGRVARDMFEGNESQAIRHMIREYDKRLVDAPAPCVVAPVSEAR